MDNLETNRKRVILSMGGKGGVGKTSVMAALAEWFALNQIPAMLLARVYRVSEQNGMDV